MKLIFVIIIISHVELSENSDFRGLIPKTLLNSVIIGGGLVVADPSFCVRMGRIVVTDRVNTIGISNETD